MEVKEIKRMHGKPTNKARKAKETKEATETTKTRKVTQAELRKPCEALSPGTKVRVKTAAKARARTSASARAGCFKDKVMVRAEEALPTKTTFHGITKTLLSESRPV
jgi:hypothetical protein